MWVAVGGFADINAQGGVNDELDVDRVGHRVGIDVGVALADAHTERGVDHKLHIESLYDTVQIHIAGHWWYTLVPTHMSVQLAERLEILPAPKIGGYFSDAYNAEWSYGKGKLLRTQIARVLTQKVLDGYFPEDTALDAARLLIRDNSVRVYGLDG